jgi:hypothetical protein
MASQTSRQTAAEQGQRMPVGTIHVVDPNPLNWLFITWNTMEEPVRTDERGHIVGAVRQGALVTQKRRERGFVRREAEVPSSEILPRGGAMEPDKELVQTA